MQLSKFRFSFLSFFSAAITNERTNGIGANGRRLENSLSQRIQLQAKNEGKLAALDSARNNKEASTTALLLYQKL